MNMNDAEHIWLRQTVTYTVDGQTRTLEIGVPVPRDASAEEIEELLRAADAGMGAISRRLDAHIAATSGGVAPQLPAPEALPTPPATSATPATTANPPAAPERAAVNGRAPAEPAPVAEPAAPSQPPQPAARPAPAPTTEPTTPPTNPRAAERPAAPQRPAEQRPAQPATPARSAASASSASMSGAEMTRPEFLAAVNELGLNPRQAMDRLKVRSLEGLNLREALESLRRQMLGAPAAPEPEPAPDIAPEPAPDAAPRYFEEEDDDETIFYTADGEDEEFDADILTPSSAAAPLAMDDASDDFMDEPDEELDLEDVPDLAPPTPTPRRRAAPTTPAARNAAATTREPAATPPPPPAAMPAAPSGGARTQAMQLIGKLRAATGGAPASDYQLAAYRNIVENELGKANATALVRGLWRTTADRLSAGQLDALIRWGKEEVFAEEAALVLAALRAEQRRAEQAGAASPAATEPAPRAASRRQSASRDGEAR